MYEKLISYLPELEGENQQFGEWIIDRVNDGSPEHPIQMPFVSFGPVMEGIYNAVYVIVDQHPELNLVKYQDILKAHGIDLDGRLMKNADVSNWDAQGVLALMLGIIRADRFSEGTFKEFMENGCYAKWIRRLKEIEDEKDDC